MNETARGRDREIAEIVAAKRAAFVGQLLLGREKTFKIIQESDFRDWPRQKLKQQRELIRQRLVGEIKKFCNQNFDGLSEQKLVNLYIALLPHRGRLRMPLLDFQKEYGRPRTGVLRGAPLHATLDISPWGLQTDYPEMHLCQDLVEAVNNLLDGRCAISEIESNRPSWEDAKRERSRIASIQRQIKFNSRMALIASFNLVEAYLNGMAWECLQSRRGKSLTEKERGLLAEDPRPVNLIDKIKRFPRIIKGALEGPLHDSRDPLQSFVEIAKPFRDAIVHASPFSAPEKFGGYDKIEKIYGLTPELALSGVNLSLNIIGEIHRFLEGDGDVPEWIPPRDSTGRFVIVDA